MAESSPNGGKHYGKRRKCWLPACSPFPIIFSKGSIFKPLPKQTILDSSKLKEVTDNNFKVDENGRKLSKRVENTVGKGEIARYEHFLLFPLCFQKTCTADT